MSSLLSPPSLPPLSLLIRLGSGVEIPRTLAWLHKVQAKVSRENWVVVYFLLARAERNFKLATQLPNLQKLLPDHHQGFSVVSPITNAMCKREWSASDQIQRHGDEAICSCFDSISCGVGGLDDNSVDGDSVSGSVGSLEQCI